jgi:hypothetical protein
MLRFDVVATLLPQDEAEARRRELQQLTRNSLAWRAFTCFMGCFACQTLWTAVAVSDPAGWFVSTAAYSGAAVLLSALRGKQRSGTAGASAHWRRGSQCDRDHFGKDVNLAPPQRAGAREQRRETHGGGLHSARGMFIRDTQPLGILPAGFCLTSSKVRENRFG